MLVFFKEKISLPRARFPFIVFFCLVVFWGFCCYGIHKFTVFSTKENTILAAGKALNTESIKGSIPIMDSTIIFTSDKNSSIF